MKKILLVPLAVMIIAALIFAGCAGGGGGGGGGEKVIDYSEAADHMGQTVTVCGPCVIVAVDAMAPLDPKPLIGVLGKLGGAEDFGSTNFMPGNMSFRLYEEMHGQLTDGGQEFVGKNICISGLTIEETPVGTIGGAVHDISQITVK